MKKFIFYSNRYHRFKKSKDASRYTGEEMAGIVGHGPTNVDLPNEASTNSEKADGMTKNQITSKQNINDYFAMKMAEKRAKMSGSVD
jgi:hypothetical protein